MKKVFYNGRIITLEGNESVESVFIENGKINEIGTHDYLKDNNEIYREVYLQQTNDNGDFDKNGGEM